MLKQMMRSNTDNKYVHSLSRVIVALLLFLVCVVSVSCSKASNKTYISRGKAYKAIALSLITEGELSHDDDNQYARYMSYLYQEGICEEDAYHADELKQNITYGEIKKLYEQLPPEEAIGAWLDDRKDDGYISENDFFTFYSYWCSKKDTHGYVTESEFVPYGLSEDKTKVYMVRGTSYTFEDIDVEQYIDKRILAVSAGDELLYVKQIVSTDVTYNNVLFISKSGDKMHVLIRGIDRELPYEKDVDTELTAESIIDINLVDGQIVSAIIKRTTITGKVLSIGTNKIEIAGYGMMDVSSDFISYAHIDNQIFEERLKSIQVGSSLHEFYVEDNVVVAAIRNGAYTYDKIRVLIENDNYKFDYHYTISLKSTSDMIISCASCEDVISAGEEWSISDGDIRVANGDRITITPADEGALMELTSVKRSLGHPSYSGSLEIIQRDGVLYLINELPVEDYLKKVVPSEMPYTYEEEALKAQAVCARTYAYRAVLMGSDLRKYGAQADDSISYQVYNNIVRDEKTDKAVDDTKGEAVWYGGSLAETYYYSTSCGASTDASIWGNPATNYPYLTSHGIDPDRQLLNLTTNEEFAAFIHNTEYPAYEKDYPYYRWEATTTNKLLNDEITRVGNILALTITKRGEGGIAEKMRVDGSTGSYTISGQNAIRAALCSEAVTITLQNGKKLSGWTSLPSSYIYIEASDPDEDNTITYHITGGGYGHGVGMSQNAAHEMAKNGMNYKEIIDFFYDDVEVK